MLARSGGYFAGNEIYHVQINDTSRIKDKAGNQADAPAGLTELVNLYVPDFYTPTPGTPGRAATDAAVVDGSTLTVKFDQALAPFAKAAGTGGFSVSGAASATTVTHVEGHATTVELTLDRTVGNTETGITLSYTAGTPAISNLHGEKAGGFTGQTVANARTDTTAPTLLSTSAINGTDVRLRFSEDLDSSAPQPAASQFALSTGGGTDLGDLTLVGIEGSVVQLTTTTAAAGSDVVTLSVTTTSNIRDLAGNQMAAASGVAVVNTVRITPSDPVMFLAVLLNGNVLRLSYNTSLDSGSVPSPAAFTVSGAHPPAIVDSVAISNRDVLLTLRKAVPGGTKGLW